MNNLLDKLFKEKLADHVQVPPANAWAKVEAGLSKKNNGWVRYRAAAAVTLLGLVTWTFVWLSSGHVDNSTHRISKVVKQKHNVAQSAQPNHEKKSALKVVPPLRLRQKSKPKSPPAGIEVTSDSTVAIHLPIPVVSENKAQEVPVPTIARVEKQVKTMVIEYTLEPVETRPVPQEKKSVAEAKEKKKLQKVLDFAWDAKNSDGTVSGLRQAKDEFFAFNFRKEKQKTTK